MKENKSKFVVRKKIVVPMAILFGIILFLGIMFPAEFYTVENAISGFGYSYFGWLYILVTVSSIILIGWLFFSKHGNIIIGGPNMKPLYKSKWSWFAVILCGDIGTGMVIWGVAEPVTFFNEVVPGVGEIAAKSQEAAVQGLGTSLLHWGIPAYAIYTGITVIIAYAAYNMRLPFRVSSALYPVFGKRIRGGLGDVVYLLCFFSIFCSVAAILAVAATTIAAGVSIFADIPTNTMLQGIVLLIVVITFIISSYTGLLKGMKFLSSLNAKLFVFLMAYVLIFGGTKFIFSLSTEAIGASVDMFATRMTYLGTISEDLWPMWWTVIYWIWMIVYGPMMGMFLAKVSRGRTLRELIGFNMLPAFFGMAWFCIFGSAAIKIDLETGDIYSAIQNKGLEASIFEFFNHFPLSMVLGIGFIIILFLSVVTMCDGLTASVSSLSVANESVGVSEPPARFKILWGVIMSSLAFVSIFANSSSADGINMLQAAKMLPMIGALPMLLIYVFGYISLVKAFTNRKKYDVVYFPETATIEKELIQDIEEE